ncbi:hypothetical protein EPI10_022952 [Gossypium australe]|uniref:Uncharacterized protein n=1 Tax=Gossypium australe TaxID=47621 RepID=A0A5B6VU30_9ROSI|nr:hypothetical protein EPI10_022952 [Gossypium australe]
MQPPYPKWYDPNIQCEYHAGITGHSIENCLAFKKLVEKLINMGVVELDDMPNVTNLLPNHANGGVNAISESSEKRIKASVAKVKTPLILVWKEMVKQGLIVVEKSRGELKNYFEHHQELGHEIQNCGEFRTLVDKAGIQVVPKVIIRRCTTEFDAVVPRKENLANNEADIQNLANMSKEDLDEGFYTRSGRHYDLIKGKTPMVEQEKEKPVEPEQRIKEPVTEEEAKEFLKFLKHSEYCVVEQLYKETMDIFVRGSAFILASEGNKILKPRISKTTRMGLKMTVGKGALSERGLEKYLQGIVVASILKEKSLDINDLSDAVIDLKYPFEEDICLEKLQDFEHDMDGDLSLDLLRMVEQEERPHKEVVEIVTLEKGKVVNFGTCITEGTRQNLIKLLQGFKDVFAWSYEDMPGLSTDIAVHRLPIRRDYKPVQQKLRRMRLDIVLKIKEEVQK